MSRLDDAIDDLTRAVVTNTPRAGETLEQMLARAHAHARGVKGPPLANATAEPPPRRYLPGDSSTRKTVPMVTGLVDYFPDALACVAEVSYGGNEKHNPGQPVHWARGKSMDHADCILRHLTERGYRDPSGVRHSAQMAWRALALLQEELEKEQNLDLPRGATAPGVELTVTEKK